MELFQKVAIFLAAGTVLLTLNIWFVRFAIDSFSWRKLPDTIAPALFVGIEDKDAKAGQALAGMILGRLGKIREEVAATVDQLRTPLSEVHGIRTQDVYEAIDIELPTGLLGPLNIEMKVGGVEVGGILNWIHRSLASDNSLRLTVENGNGRATVSGSWNDGRDTLWFEVTGDQSKLITNDRIASAVAYALTQRQIASRMGEVGALTAQEFEELMTTLESVAKLNSQAAWGRAAETEFAALFARIDKLVARTPRWKGLVHFSAKLADRGGNAERALVLYKDMLALLDSKSELHQDILNRIVVLSDRLRTLASVPLTKQASSVAPPKALSTWPLSALGIASLDMPAKVRIGVLGGLPSEGTLDPSLYEIVGGGTSKPDDKMMAEYVRTVVQAVQLVAPNASFAFAKSTAKDGTNSDSGIADELEALAKAKPDIILATFGPVPGSLYLRVIETIILGKTLVVLPAGNNRGEPPPFDRTPLADKVLVAASIDSGGKPSGFTQEGKTVLWVPGEKIPLKPLGEKINLLDGTTYSAALAAGVAARILAEYPGIEPNLLVSILRDSAQPFSDGGQRVVHLSRALQLLKDRNPSQS